MAALIHWPRWLAPRSAPVDMTERSAVAPPSLSGFTQAVWSPASSWRVAARGFPLNTPQRIRFWRALSGQIRGRSGIIVLPVWQRSQLQPWPGAPGDPSVAVTNDDGSTHADGTGYAQPALAAVVAAAPRGAVTLTMTVLPGMSIGPGDGFSIGHRYYEITAVDAVDGDVYEVGIRPRLRVAVPDLETADFSTPTMRVRLANDAGMHLPLDYGRIAVVDVSFIEDPT